VFVFPDLIGTVEISLWRAQETVNLDVLRADSPVPLVVGIVGLSYTISGLKNSS